MTLPVAGYYRVSVARDNMHAPELYEEEIKRYCLYKKLDLARVFSDVDYSAFRGARPRPALEQLVENRHGYTAIVIPKLSRFGRSVKELVRLFDIFDSDSIPLVFLDMNLDTSTSQGRLLRHILAAFAEYESDVKADYTRANHRRARAEGRAWGTPPFGYAIGDIPGRWIVDEVAATTIRALFASYVAGASANAIARELNAAGVTTARGTRWEGIKVGKLLDNPAYAALCVLDDTLVDATWPAIVDRATWDAARSRRAHDPRRTGNLGKRRPVAPYLLSKLLWCGQCGRRMSHTTTTRDHAGLYLCEGEDWGTWTGCRNARLYGSLVEGYISDAFLKRCAFTIITETGSLAGSPRSLWAGASLQQKKHLLSLVIDRIVATPAECDVPRSQWRTRLRHDLEIEWKADVAAGEEIVVISDAPPSSERRVVSDGRHQMLRALESSQAQQRRTRRSEIAKSYFEDWGKVCDRLRDATDFRQSPSISAGDAKHP
ncbi:MAG: recombinase family protein [Actinomycetota bacterium]